MIPAPSATENPAESPTEKLRGRRAVKILAITCTLVVAAIFVLSGLQKIRPGNPTGTILWRDINSPQAIRAMGCMEIALALWMATFRSPKIGAAVAVCVLIGFSYIIARELRSSAPLPCGCMETWPGADPQAIRHGLWFSLARNVFLMGLAIAGAALFSDQDVDSAAR